MTLDMGFIQDVFDSLGPSDPYPLLSYVDCVSLEPLRRARRGWYEHTEPRVTLASMLSVCSYCSDNLRFCSRELARSFRVSYRRLEDYARFVGFVWRGMDIWLGFGKLVEVCLYYHYVMPKRRRWERHLEMRLFFAIPIHVNDYEALIRAMISDLDEIARFVLESVYDIEFAWEVELDYEDSVKFGIREVTVHEIERVIDYAARFGVDVSIPLPFAPRSPGGLEATWCNGVLRAPYSYFAYVILDYRRGVGYSSNYGYDQVYYPVPVRIEDWICEWFRWW